MIRDAVTQVEAAEPAIGQVQMNLFAQAAFGSMPEQYPTSNIRPLGTYCVSPAG
jgi:hypothetical protein